MASLIRFRKLCFLEPVKSSSYDEKPKTDEKQQFETFKLEKTNDQSANSAVIKEHPKRKKQNKPPKEWRCIDSCCWIIGYLCTTWWLLLFLYHSLPTNFAGLKSPEPPGTRLRRDGLTALHPVILVPGIVTGGLELWEGKPCSEGLFRRRLWGGSFTEIFKRFELQDWISFSFKSLFLFQFENFGFL